MSQQTKAIRRTREEMAQRLAMDIPNGSYVNLGIGIPELVARFVPEGRTLIYHTENGLLGMGPSPDPADGDPELINAGKRHIKILPDGWTAVTKDHKPSAQWEHTLLVTADGVEVLTRRAEEQFA